MAIAPASGPVTNTVVSNYTAILSGFAWYGQGVTNHPAIVTYSFNTSAQTYLADAGGSQELIDSFQPFTSGLMPVARQALAQWAGASGLTFVEAPAGQGDIQFGRYDFTKDETFNGFDGYAYYPHVTMAVNGSSDLAIGGDVFINTGSNPNDVGISLLLHEIGHALGFKHPFEGDPTLEPPVDDKQHTVMSYTGGPVSNLGPFDHDAVEFVYGAPNADGTNLANWSYNVATSTLTQTGTAGADTIRGTYGKDIISGTGGDDLLFGSFGADNLTGNAGRDTLIGYDGNDTLTGTLGADRLDGGAGADVFTYRRYQDSHGKAYDTVVRFDALNADKIDAGGTVTGVDHTVAGGNVSEETIRTDLRAILDNDHLLPHHAVLVSPDGGDLMGKTFLIVDLNGAAGFDGGFDVVVLLESPLHAGRWDATDFI